LRKSTTFLLLIAVLTIALLLSILDAGMRRTQTADRLVMEAQLVAGLELTDLVISTEARYTRHWSQADYHAAFQDYPSALEHFPAGSLLPPPARLY